MTSVDFATSIRFGEARLSTSPALSLRHEQCERRGVGKGMVVFRRNLREVREISYEMIGISEGETVQMKKESEQRMTDIADPRVDAYIAALPEWQQAICREVRDLVHAADPAVTETIKRTVQPYFVLNGNICALLAAKDHINVFLYDGAIVPDPEHIITAGHHNTSARTVAFRQGEKINAPALSEMFRHIIANNRAGGWRKIKQGQ